MFAQKIQTKLLYPIYLIFVKEVLFGLPYPLLLFYLHMVTQDITLNLAFKIIHDDRVCKPLGKLI